MIHVPCVSTLVRRPSRTLKFTDALTNSQRPTSRCGRWHVLCAFARALYDALFCAYAGCGPLRTVQIVEPACSRAPTYARSNVLMLVPRLARLGEALMRCVLGHALHSMMRALQSIYWGASSLAAIAFVSFVVGQTRAVIREAPVRGRRLLIHRVAVDPSSSPLRVDGAVIWRASDAPIRHVLRMATWNAPGWPLLRERFVGLAPALYTVWEEPFDDSPPSEDAVPYVPHSSLPAPPPEASVVVLSDVTAGPTEGSRLECDAVSDDTALNLAPPPDATATVVPEVSFPASLAEPSSPTSSTCARCPRGCGSTLDLSNRFDGLEIEDPGTLEDAPRADEFALQTERPPGAPTPRRGPRAPREVRDLESYLMRPVPMRRRTESARVLAAHASFLQYWFRRTRASSAIRHGRCPGAPSA